MDDQEREARSILAKKGWSKMDASDRMKVQFWLSNYKGDDEVIDSGDLTLRLLEDKTPCRSFKTGLPSLDKYTEGFRDGELIIVGGKTKGGKTLLCQTLTKKISAQGIMPMWFSYEMTNKEIIERYTGRIVDGEFMERNPEQPPNFCLPSMMAERSVKWVGDKIAEGIVKKDVRVVFIDHLHFLVNLGKNGNLSLEIGQIVRELKQIARIFNIVIFLICHINRAGAINKEYSEDDLRDSSLTAAEADSTFMVYRDDPNSQEMAGDENPFSTLVICNHRYTGARLKKIRMIKVGKMLEEANTF